MLPDPLVVTYDGTAKSMPRTGVTPTPVGQLVASTSYSTADGEFNVKVESFKLGKGVTRREVILTRTTPDPDGPFAGSYPFIPNSFGVIYHTNETNYSSVTDIPKLRSALLSFLDTTTQGRVLSGEQ